MEITQELIEALGQVYELFGPASMKWLELPNTYLEGKSPLKMIQDGEVAKLNEVLSGFAR